MVYNFALLLPSSICLFGAAWLICKRESNIRSQNVLMAGFLVSTLFFLCTAHYVVGSLDKTTFMWWDIIDSFVAMLVAPSMYLYLSSMVREGGFTWREYIWFMPAIIVGFGTAGIYMAMDKTEVDGYIQSVLIEGKRNTNYSGTIYKLHQFVGVQIYNLAALIQVVSIGILVIVRLKRYHQRLREFYSDADDKSIDTDNKIVDWLIFTIPLSLALVIPDILFWREHPVLSSLLFIAWAVVYFALFYYGSQMRHTADDFAQDLQQADLEEIKVMDEQSWVPTEAGDQTQEIHISSEVHQRLAILFDRLIDEQKIYLKSDLRLDEVARLMFTNRAYVSKVIKQRHNSSFSDYMNSRRIDHSMELMRNDPNLTQDKIAEKSGFVNAQSYSRAFRKIIGVPPKEWAVTNLHRP